MTESMLRAKKDFSRFGFALLIIIAVTCVLQLILSLIWKEFLTGTNLGDMELMRWIITMAPMYLVAVPLALIVMKKIPAEEAPRQKLGAGRFFVLFLIGMPFMYCGNYLGNVLSSLLSGGTAENALLDYIMGNPLYSFLFTVLLAPVMEELIFRKQIIDRLGRYGEKNAILFSAFTFGLFHTNLFQFFYAFGLGLIFAYVYTRTRMLRYPILMHMLINLMGGVIAPMLLSLLDADTLAVLEAGTATTEQILQILPGMIAYLVYFLVYMGGVIAGFILLLVRWNKTIFLPASSDLLPGNRKVIYCNPGMLLFVIFCLIMTAAALFAI